MTFNRQSLWHSLVFSWIIMPWAWPDTKVRKVHWLIMGELLLRQNPQKMALLNRILNKYLTNNYFLNRISALVKEMGGNLFRNYEFDFSRVFWVRSSEKHKKYVWFSNEVRKSHAFLCFSRDLTQNTREKSNSKLRLKLPHIFHSQVQIQLRT